MIFLTEAQRFWLEKHAAEYGPDWLLLALRREDPKRRGLDVTHWQGREDAEVRMPSVRGDK